MDYIGGPSKAEAIYVKESGSIQSHLSAANSQQRLRIAPSAPENAEKAVKVPDDAQLLARPTGRANKILIQVGLPPSAVLPGPNHGHGRHTLALSWPTLLIKCIAGVYCFLSCVVLTVDCYKYLYISLASDNVPQQVNYLDSLSLGHQFSRLSASMNVLDLEPYLLSDPTNEDDVTACFWIEDIHDLTLISTWSRTWPGPLSILLSTTTPISSSLHSDLLRKIQNLGKHFEKGQLSLHILHVQTHNYSARNMYLNLARLFSRTRRVVLFPAPAQYVAGPELHSLVYNQDSPFPAVITTPTRVAYPFSEFSPILLRRNHTIWCTERYSTHEDHVTDWEECIWQIWAESLGNSRTILIHGIPDVTRKPDSIHLRMSAIFRAENCDLAIRNFNVQNRDAKLSLLWLKSFCAQTVDKRYKI